MVEFYFLPSYRFPEATEATAYLGSVIKYYDNVDSGYVPEDGDFTKYIKDPIKFKDYDVFDVKATAVAKRSRTNSIGLSDAVNAGKTSQKRSGRTFSASKLCYRRLQHEDMILAAYLRSDVFRARAGKWIKHRNAQTACMVVGMLICDDLVLSDAEQASDDMHVKGTVPILSATITALAALPISLPDPSLAIGHGTSSERRLEGTYRGAKIIGLEYRWIRRPWLSSEITVGRSGPSSIYHLAGPDDEDHIDYSPDEEEEEDRTNIEAWGEDDVKLDEEPWLDAVAA